MIETLNKLLKEKEKLLERYIEGDSSVLSSLEEIDQKIRKEVEANANQRS